MNSAKEKKKKNNVKVSAKICSFRKKVRNMNTKGRGKKKEQIYYKIRRVDFFFCLHKKK